MKEVASAEEVTIEEPATEEVAGILETNVIEDLEGLVADPKDQPIESCGLRFLSIKYLLIELLELRKSSEPKSQT